ncbi:unnamed protein product [marine sediment metagenome]|uniref:Periplasmic copper-binding protein NosD beta helix domain-containing protein n=1 Tax=marine sediment metagenome TaxID=412755 RepID=X1A527_9ZZZZ
MDYIHNHQSGIQSGGKNNEITCNMIYNNQGNGIRLEGYHFGIITLNNITGNDGIGLLLTYNYDFRDNVITGKRNKILYNNIYNNAIDAFFEFNYLTRWDQNYWGIDSEKPYIISGRTSFLKNIYIPKSIIPWINIDWHPATEPFDIPNPEVRIE